MRHDLHAYHGVRASGKLSFRVACLLAFDVVFRHISLPVLQFTTQSSGQIRRKPCVSLR